MKKLSQLLFLALISFVIACDDETEFSPATATLVETGAWPGQSIRIDFDNQESKPYPVTFGTTTVVPESHYAGLIVSVPELPEGPVTIKMSVPNGELILKRISLSAPSHRSYMRPLPHSATGYR